MNVDNMLRLADYLETVPPEEFAMFEWGCGTTACIGGHAERLFERPENLAEVLGFPDTGPPYLHGILSQLFYPDTLNCPELRDDVLYNHLWGRMESDPGPTITPKQAARVVRHLANTGVVDWTLSRD